MSPQKKIYKERNVYDFYLLAFGPFSESEKILEVIYVNVEIADYLESIARMIFTPMHSWIKIGEKEILRHFLVFFNAYCLELVDAALFSFRKLHKKLLKEIIGFSIKASEFPRSFIHRWDVLIWFSVYLFVLISWNLHSWLRRNPKSYQLW